MNKPVQIDRKERTICSALWAAYGDAIGFTTELADIGGLKSRTGGIGEIAGLVDWRRQIGGRFGALVNLPAGTYSDDTQLRLATCRSIRGDGFFDVESFAKIELPVWLGYALGGGIGSKAAAGSLSSRSTTWYSNFYSIEKLKYIQGGGNGAAMRIQPHVWASTNLGNPLTYLGDVVRDAVVTHGHVRGIAGAMIHADALAFVLRENRIPRPEEWIDYVSTIKLLPRIVEADSDLKTFWLPTWEHEAGVTLAEATRLVCSEWSEASSFAASAVSGGAENYAEVVQTLGGLRPEERGSGLKAALLSLCAVWGLQDLTAERTLSVVANLLGSDTDTIGTMAGALLGALPSQAMPVAEIQDRTYIEFEASRLYSVSQGQGEGSFVYPDLLYWQPPKTPLDTLGFEESSEKLALSGLGWVEPIGQTFPVRQGESFYQWMKTEFGQTVLCKQRAEPRIIPNASLPLRPKKGRLMEENMSLDLFGSNPRVERQPANGARPKNRIEDHPPSLDAASDEAIGSSFDPEIIGRHLLRFADADDGLERAVAYVAIVVKARRARLKRASGSK